MDNLHIVTLAEYNRPKIKEQNNRDWVSYGDNNDYYSYLIKLFINSATNNAIIQGVSQMIYGKGIDALDSSSKPNEYAAMRSIFNDNDLRNVILDLKLLGEGSFQVLYQDKKVVKAEHFPRQTLRAEKCNDDGEIEAYYYFHDWTKIKPSSKPKRISAFGFGNGKEPEIKIVKRYVSGYDYYCPVDYQGALAYAELESEISDYLINDVQNGFSGTKVVNFNNGVPDREKQLQVKGDVMNKLTGARGEKVIIAFNNNAESKTTIDDVPLTDAPAHYQYLSNECSNKLIIGHRITSPLLLGIRTENNGLGSNAEEIKTASLLFDNVTIKPYQDLITECMKMILSVNDISLKLYFKTLQPLSFIETDNAVTDEAREEETGIKLSEELYNDVPKEHINELLEKGENEEDLIKDGWELVDSRPVEYEQEEGLDKMVGLASTGTARPNAKSKQDGENEEGFRFRVRYQYSPLKTTKRKIKDKTVDVTRDFCDKMITAKKLYRKEDIQQMSNKPVNAGFGVKSSATYDIWFYKGGANCHHFWMRKTFMSKKEGSNPDVKNPNADISVNKAKKEGFKPEKNNIKVAKRPIDMPNNGYKNPR
jgi:hypothetical protein